MLQNVQLITGTGASFSVNDLPPEKSDELRCAAMSSSNVTEIIVRSRIGQILQHFRCEGKQPTTNSAGTWVCCT